MDDITLSAFQLGCIVLGTLCIGAIMGAIGITAMAGASLRELRDVFLGDPGR